MRIGMELRMSSVVYLLGLLLISLIGKVLSKSLWLTDNAGDFSLNKVKSCTCEVHVLENEVTVSDEKQIEAFKWPDSDCRYVHQRCRAICRLKLDLHVRDENSVQRGYAFCNQYKQVTPEGGVMLAARWHVHGCPHDTMMETMHHERLCCGHTTVPLDGNDNTIRAYGWNPDCKAEAFVLGKN